MRAAALGLASLVVLSELLAPGTVWAQCAMCQTALTNSPEGQRIATEFNKAILLMMAAPYAVFGGIVAFVFRARARRLLPFRVRRTDPGL